nr:transposase [Hyalangium versicolor]
MTHWSTRSLALAARRQGIASTISHSTVALILRDAELQPHRSRYWKTPVPDETFRAQAAKVLWCYEHVVALAEQGEVVLCVDEKPNIQALERRRPTRTMRPGLIEQQEFEYVRHGTVNFLVKLVVPTGLMRGWCLEHNDSASLRAVLPQLLGEHRDARRIHLIWDNGASPIFREEAGRAAPNSAPTSTPVGPSTTASTPTRSLGPGRGPRCTSGWIGTAPDYVERFRGQSTRGCWIHMRHAMALCIVTQRVSTQIPTRTWQEHEPSSPQHSADAKCQGSQRGVASRAGEHRQG